MRDLWKTTNITYGAKLGYAKMPIKLKSSGIRSLLSKTLFQQNVRPVLEKGNKRHEFKTCHGFRNIFKSQAEQCMLAANVELMFGHDLGLSSSYYKPLEKDLLVDYLRGVKNLAIYKKIDEKIAKEIQDLRTCKIKLVLMREPKYQTIKITDIIKVIIFNIFIRLIRSFS